MILFLLYFFQMCEDSRASLHRLQFCSFRQPHTQNALRKTNQHVQACTWKGIKYFFLAYSVNDPHTALTTLKATQVTSETVQQFRVNCSSAWFKHRYSCLQENNDRKQIVPFQMQTGEKKHPSLFPFSLPTPHPQYYQPLEGIQPHLLPGITDIITALA